MEEINLKELFNYFLSKIAIIIVTFAVVLLVGGIYSLCLKTPRYSSSTTLILVSGENDKKEDSITQEDISLNQKLIATYRQIIKSRRVLNQVIENLDLDCKYEELTDNISVTTDADTELIRITVNDTDPENARLIADEIATVFSNEIVEIYSIKNISIIDRAILNTKPYNMNFVKEVIIYSLVGIVLGVGIVFVIFYFDTTIKSTEEIQEKLGLPVLGVVPKVERKKKKKSKKGAK